jgi:hypothetical protein
MFTCLNREKLMVLTDSTAIIGLFSVEVRRYRHSHEQNDDG